MSSFLKYRNCASVLGILLISLIASFVNQSSLAQTRPRSRAITVNASKAPGADLGAQINAADKALGNASGEIIVSGGGTILTQVTISSDHILRLSAGTYVTKTTTIPFLLKPRASIIGSGWDSIITESTAPGQFTVIIAYNNSVNNALADTDLLIRDVQIRGANSGFNSTYQAISLGNCSNCTVDNVWINSTRSIGIQLGGSSSLGNLAENSKVVNCLFTRVASQNLALVNGRNIIFERNRFLNSGQIGGPGNTNIDLEPNESTDHIENVIIRNNLIDVRKSEVRTTGNGIVVQATTGTPYVGPILVEKNTIFGGNNTDIVTYILSNGIFVFGATMRNVTVRDNVITRTGQAGINISGTRLNVINNRMTDVGGGGTPGFIVGDLTNSRIEGNTFTYSGKGSVDGRIVITGSSKGNVYRDNRGFTLAGNTK